MVGDNFYICVLCCWNIIVNYKVIEWNYWYYVYLNYVFVLDYEWNVKKKMFNIKKNINIFFIGKKFIFILVKY